MRRHYNILRVGLSTWMKIKSILRLFIQWKLFVMNEIMLFGKWYKITS